LKLKQPIVRGNITGITEEDFEETSEDDESGEDEEDESESSEGERTKKKEV
jgi:hypothetical protein